MSTERPSPPLNLNFSDQIKTAVTLTWETPINNGGSMITGYIIEKCEDGSDKWLRCNARLCPDLSYRVCSQPEESAFILIQPQRSYIFLPGLDCFVVFFRCLD